MPITHGIADQPWTVFILVAPVIVLLIGHVLRRLPYNRIKATRDEAIVRQRSGFGSRG